MASAMELLMRFERSVVATSDEVDNADDSKMEKLSGVMIVIIIGGGVLTFIMLFIFAKRQIMRFTLRGRRGPHVAVGTDAKKALRREIERRLDCIQKIAQEPKLLWNEDDKYIMPIEQQTLPPYYYRMKAVDNVKVLESEITRADGATRRAHDSLRAFLLTTLAAILNGNSQRMVHQFCDMYEHARHDPNEFGQTEYEAYQRLLLKLIEAAKQLKQFNSRKTSPARTPRKQTKMHSLLDPSRLRPPPLESTTTGGGVQLQSGSELTAGQHSKVNLTLGLQGGESGLATSDALTTNPLHLQVPAERDLIIRNRIKTPTLDDVVIDDANSNDGNSEADDNEIMSISSVQFHRNSSVV